LKAAKDLGYFRSETIDERPIHFSNPSYVQIKPSYRANHPLPNFNNLDMKARYSFNSFGEPYFKRQNQDTYQSIFRSTLQHDTPYYMDSGKSYNAAHAMVDPSHTFIEDGKHFSGKGKSIHHLAATNFRNKFNVYQKKE